MQPSVTTTGCCTGNQRGSGGGRDQAEAPAGQGLPPGNGASLDANIACHDSNLQLTRPRARARSATNDGGTDLWVKMALGGFRAVGR